MPHPCDNATHAFYFKWLIARGASFVINQSISQSICQLTAPSVWHSIPYSSLGLYKKTSESRHPSYKYANSYTPDRPVVASQFYVGLKEIVIICLWSYPKFVARSSVIVSVLGIRSKGQRFVSTLTHSIIISLFFSKCVRVLYKCRP